MEIVGEYFAEVAEEMHCSGFGDTQMQTPSLVSCRDGRRRSCYVGMAEKDENWRHFIVCEFFNGGDSSSEARDTDSVC